MGVQLICDQCKRPVLSAIPLIQQQNPTAISGAICIECLGKRMRVVELRVKEVDEEDLPNHRGEDA